MKKNTHKNANKICLRSPEGSGDAGDLQWADSELDAHGKLHSGDDFLQEGHLAVAVLSRPCGGSAFRSWQCCSPLGRFFWQKGSKYDRNGGVGPKGDSWVEQVASLGNPPKKNTQKCAPLGQPSRWPQVMTNS